MVSYQSLITQSMYDKQLDSGIGTLLHLCDDVIQQEVGKKSLAIFSTLILSYITLACSLTAGKRGDNMLLYIDGDG